MGFTHAKPTLQEEKFFLDVFRILAPGKWDVTTYFGVAKGTPNFVDGQANPQYGICDPIPDTEDDYNFFPSSDCMGKWFYQQMITYAANEFGRGQGGALVPRQPNDPAFIRLPLNWKWTDEAELSKKYKAGNYQFLIDRLQYYFKEDAVMGELVMALVAPADSTSE